MIIKVPDTLMYTQTFCVCIFFLLPITDENAKEGSKISTIPDEKDDNFLKGVSFTTIGKSDL